MMGIGGIEMIGGRRDEVGMTITGIVRGRTMQIGGENEITIQDEMTTSEIAGAERTDMTDMTGTTDTTDTTVVETARHRRSNARGTVAHRWQVPEGRLGHRLGTNAHRFERPEITIGAIMRIVRLTRRKMSSPGYSELSQFMFMYHYRIVMHMCALCIARPTSWSATTTPTSAPSDFPDGRSVYERVKAVKPELEPPPASSCRACLC